MFCSFFFFFGFLLLFCFGVLLLSSSLLFCSNLHKEMREGLKKKRNVGRVNRKLQQVGGNGVKGLRRTLL